MPSGGTAETFERWPADYGGVPSLIPVPARVLDRLLADAEEKAREHMEYVDEEHEALAVQVYAIINKPSITLRSAWDVFARMIAVIDTNV